METKRNADFLATYLSQNNVPTTSIHGDRLQREREEALRCFKKGSHNVLVATGVAARGLDIKNVKHVINVDLPKSIDEYVHRIGRTGRVGNKGKATSFFDDSEDGPLSGNLARILKQAGQSIPDWLGRGGGGSYSGSGFGGQDVRGVSFFCNCLMFIFLLCYYYFVCVKVELWSQCKKCSSPTRTVNNFGIHDTKSFKIHATGNLVRLIHAFMYFATVAIFFFYHCLFLTVFLINNESSAIFPSNRSIKTN